MKSLNRQLIIAKCKTDNLRMIKNLNLWGNELDDVEILREMSNLEVLSLSVNKISTLKDFINCQMLKELYLRQNHIKSIGEIKHLQKLPNLRILWLSENPCAKHPNYRKYVIKMLPNLIKLDKENITNIERDEAMGLNDLQEEEPEQQFNRKVDILDLSDEKRVSDNNNDYQPKQMNSGHKMNEEKKPYPYKRAKEEQHLNFQRQPHQSSASSRQGPPKRTESEQYLYKEPVEYYQQHNQHNYQSQEKFRPKQNRNVQKNPYLEDNRHQHRNNNHQRHEHRQEQNMGYQKRRKNHKDFIQNENVVSAILALIKELNTAELDFLKREIEKKIEKHLYYMN